MITSATTLAFNTTVTMKCHEGYYNKATESNFFTIICEAAGQWSNAKPCLEYRSNPPTSYTSGPGLTTPDDRITTVSSSTLNYATEEEPTPSDQIVTTTEYTCEAGYYAAPAAEQSTTQSPEHGTLTHTNVDCYKYCRSLSSVENTMVVEASEEPFTIVSIARLQCESGYHHFDDYSAEAEYRCNEDGEWVGALKCCFFGFSWKEDKGKCCLLGALLGVC